MRRHPEIFNPPLRAPRLLTITEEELIAEVDRAWRSLKRKITRSSQLSEEDKQIIAALHAVLYQK